MKFYTAAAFFGIVPLVLLSGCTAQNMENIDASLLPYTLEEAQASEKVLIEDFSDVQCGHCKTLNPVLNQLKEDLPEVEFKAYQFPFLGPQSFPSAVAIECVAMQDASKKDKYAAKVFAANTLSAGIRKDFAEEMNLDIEAFEQCTNGNESKPIVDAMRKEGQNRGVTSTPTIFINGERYEGSRDYDTLYTEIQKAANPEQ